MHLFRDSSNFTRGGPFRYCKCLFVLRCCWEEKKKQPKKKKKLSGDPGVGSITQWGHTPPLLGPAGLTDKSRAFSLIGLLRVFEPIESCVCVCV